MDLLGVPCLRLSADDPEKTLDFGMLLSVARRADNQDVGFRFGKLWVCAARQNVMALEVFRRVTKAALARALDDVHA